MKWNEINIFKKKKKTNKHICALDLYYYHSHQNFKEKKSVCAYNKNKTFIVSIALFSIEIYKF